MWWILAIATIIGGIAAIDYFCNGCIKKFNLLAYFRLRRLMRKQEPMMEPSGTVPLNSPFYIERPPIETDCYKNINHTDALVRIKAPRQMGKSSLLIRILAHAEQHEGCRTVYLSFQEIDNEIFKSLDRFLHWLCGRITEKLELLNELDKNWQGVLGSKSKCMNYFDKFILSAITEGVVA